MKYAQKRSEQQKRKHKWKSDTKYILPTEMLLPSPETIRQQNPDEAAIKENMELMEYKDNYSIGLIPLALRNARIWTMVMS